MSVASSCKACWEYANDYQKLPFTGGLVQLPEYLLSYFEGRLSSRLGFTPSPRRFSFRMNRKFDAFIEPSQFGMAKGILQDLEYAGLPISTPRTILDLGANVGLGLLALRDLYPSSKFACVEADPRNFQLLTKNLSINNFQAVLISAAVAGEQGLLDFRIGENTTCSTLVDASGIHPGHTDSIVVPVLTMHQVLEYLAWPEVDLLKIDIEGAEDSLFSGNPSWLNQINSIVIEIHPNTTPEKVQDQISPYGFRLRRHGHGREPVFFADRTAA